jgi:hypothetical protein
MDRDKIYCCRCRYYKPVKCWQVWRWGMMYDCCWGGNFIDPNRMRAKSWTYCFNEYNTCLHFERKGEAVAHD